MSYIQDLFRQKTQRWEELSPIDRQIIEAIIDCDESRAVRLIQTGADVNLVNPRNDLPLIHETAGLGFRRVVDAILETERCDLTVRDPMGRLASEVAERVARDADLADRLADVQARQFRTAKLDPRRPENPDYGNWCR